MLVCENFSITNKNKRLHGGSDSYQIVFEEFCLSIKVVKDIASVGFL